jgi:hypothetical protein
MSRVDRMRVEAVQLLSGLGYVYAHRWTAPANANPIITARGFYYCADPRYVAHITTASEDAVHGVFIGSHTTFENYCLGDVWTPAAWRSDGLCLIPSPDVALSLDVTARCDLADLPQP